jgi:type IV secretion system protein TrbG
MAAVAWRYPQDEIAQLENALEHRQQLAQATTATSISIDKLNFAYGLAVVAGRPQWVPLQVFDDGHKTYIRFPAAMLDREAPALFVVSSAGDTQLVNYRVKNDTFVVDRLFEMAELRVGQQSQEIVRIVRTR